jgi:hypothetical protein
VNSNLGVTEVLFGGLVKEKNSISLSQVPQTSSDGSSDQSTVNVNILEW